MTNNLGVRATLPPFVRCGGSAARRCPTLPKDAKGSARAGGLDRAGKEREREYSRDSRERGAFTRVELLSRDINSGNGNKRATAGTR